MLRRIGTTAMQARMLQNTGALAVSGTAYWGPDRTRAGLAGAGQGFMRPDHARWMPLDGAPRVAMVAQYREDIAWLRVALPGIDWMDVSAERTGANPGAATEEEGHDHDRQASRLA
ncbi:hypothetical protein AB4874_01565 [Thioclava sp. 15-R06ZXC-3]|uniref:Uncharacterized protein n=1 Tax=Thioclava arctica TaxID=3238301 RepID=A0ABV3THL0_9RHOB